MIGSIAAFYTFYFALIGVHVIFLPKILSMVGMDATQIGIIFAMAPLIRFVAPWAFIRGWSIDNRMFMIALGMMLMGAMSFYGALGHFWALVASNLLFGMGIALILPFVEVIALEVIGKERYGRIRLFGSLGFIAVALVLVNHLTSPSIGILFLVLMAAMTLLFGMIITLLPHPNPHTEPIEHTTFTLAPYGWLWGGLILMQVSFGPFYGFFTLYATDHGVSMEHTIWLWSFGVVAEIGMFFVQGWFLHRSLLGLMIFSSLLTALRWFLVSVGGASVEILAFSQALHAFSFALFHTASIALLFRLYPMRRLTQQVYFGLTYGLGGMVGSLISGWLYHHYGAFLFLFGALMALGASAMFYAQSRSM